MKGKKLIVWMVVVLAVVLVVRDFVSGLALTGTPSVAESLSVEERLVKLAEKNLEAREFVEDYPNREQYVNIEIDLSEEVRAGEVPHLLQWDKRWGYEPFGDDMIALSGCGPVCLSMAYIYLTGDLAQNPKEMAAYTEKEGYLTLAGTDWSLWTVGVSALGLSGKELSLDETQMRTALDEGAVIVCSMRPGDFTSTGHYILLKGYDEAGFWVNDPNSIANSQKSWSFEDIRFQIKNLWRLDSAFEE